MSKGKAPNGYCTILAGPNGSGKSTIYALLDPVGEFVNADIVARQLAPGSPEAVSMAAGRLILARLDDIVGHVRDFVYETTLSSRQSLALMERCKASGYEIALVYVALDNPEMNIERVAERVLAGGHHIEDAVIRRRYETAFNRLPRALELADRILIFDNSNLKPLLLMAVDRGNILENHLDRNNVLHLRLAGSLANAFRTSRDTLLRASQDEKDGK